MIQTHSGIMLQNLTYEQVRDPAVDPAISEMSFFFFFESPCTHEDIQKKKIWRRRRSVYHNDVCNECRAAGV